MIAWGLSVGSSEVEAQHRPALHGLHTRGLNCLPARTAANIRSADDICDTASSVDIGSSEAVMA